MNAPMPANCVESILLLGNGKVRCGSDAVLGIAAQLPWYWQWSQLFWLFPFFIREPVYRWIASNRYRWFGKQESCHLPTPELQSRFLPEHEP